MTHPTSNLASQHARLVLWSTLAGVASAGLSLVFGDLSSAVRGGLLGLCLSLGVVGLNQASRTQLSAGQAPDRLKVLLAGTASGLLAGVGVALFVWWQGSLSVGFGHFPLAMPPRGAAAVVLGLCYGLALHSAYAMRWRFATGRSLRAFFCVLGAGLLCGTAKGALAARPAPEVMPWAGLFAGLPFAFLWAWVNRRLDPAWTSERWRELAAPAPGSPK